MILRVSTFIVLTLCVSLEAYPGCTKINKYENGLPASIEYLAKEDYFGRLISFGYGIYMQALQHWPDYGTSEKYCHSQLLKTSDHVYLKTSLRPRGCCSHCCLIQNVENHLNFYYFTKNKTVEVIPFGKKKKRGTLARLGFKSESKTIVWLHGFSEDGYFGRSVSIVADVYLAKDEHYNVLALDFSELSLLPWYFEAIDNGKLIKKAAARFLSFYHKTGELDLKKVHIIGVSLGAQLASQIAKELKKVQKVDRVTGLDPAITIYRDDDYKEGFSKGDAGFVDILHTSGVYRDIKPTGHADFYVDYPPGTTFRPGCNLLEMINRGELIDYFLCDHLRALRVYVQTVAEPKLFPICKNVMNGNKTKEICGYAGFAATKSTTVGEYHFPTQPGWNPWKEIHY